MRYFAGPNKGFVKQRPGLAKCGGGFGVGMSEAIDLAVAEAEPPTGGEA
jgi:hypothetical protein